MGIDNHNRSAHLGLGLLPSSRGKGYGTDVVDAVCQHGVLIRGLQRLQIETLSDNAAMLRSAERNGFVREGVLRSAAPVERRQRRSQRFTLCGRASKQGRPGRAHLLG